MTTRNRNGYFQRLREFAFHCMRRYRGRESQQAQAFQSNDIFLVEFPKSGITYLSFLLGATLAHRYQLSLHPTFFNHHRFVVDIHQLRTAVPVSLGGVPYRFFKSHHHYRPDFYFVIYLIRDVYSVVWSYYRFLTSHGMTKTLDQFIDDGSRGPRMWAAHVDSWLNAEDLPQRIIVLRYDELLDDPQGVLKYVFQNLGVQVSSKTLEMAIEWSSRNQMRESEALYAAKSYRYAQSELTFVSANAALAAQDALTYQQKKRISEIVLQKVDHRFFERLKDMQLV